MVRLGRQYVLQRKMRVAERPGGVLEPGMCGHLLHGNRPPARRAYASERRSVSFSLNIQIKEERPVKEKFCTTGMSSSRKSDNNIVPEKPANNEGKTFAEQVEGRGGGRQGHNGFDTLVIHAQVCRSHLLKNRSTIS